MEKNKGFEHINHLIRLGLNNCDGLLWKFEVGLYTDETKKDVRGMPIGFMTSKGFVSNPNDKEWIYRCVLTEDGCVMFFRKPRERYEYGN